MLGRGIIGHISFAICHLSVKTFGSEQNDE